MAVDRNVAFVERMTWDRAKTRIDEGVSAILPIGAAAKQHGLHLPLETDRIQGEWFAEQLAQRVDALIWPTVTYGHYPAFTEYAGSISLSAAVFAATVREIAGSILGQDCRALFVLDSGAGTADAPRLSPLARAANRDDESLFSRNLEAWNVALSNDGFATLA